MRSSLSLFRPHGNGQNVFGDCCLRRGRAWRVVFQAKDAEARCDKLLDLHKEFHKRLDKGSVRLSKIVDGLFENPATTVLHIKNQFGISHPTARADLKKLAAMGIIRELNKTEHISYFCPEIYRVTYEDLI